MYTPEQCFHDLQGDRDLDAIIADLESTLPGNPDAGAWLARVVEMANAKPTTRASKRCYELNVRIVSLPWFLEARDAIAKHLKGER